MFLYFMKCRASFKYHRICVKKSYRVFSSMDSKHLWLNRVRERNVFVFFLTLPLKWKVVSHLQSYLLGLDLRQKLIGISASSLSFTLLLLGTDCLKAQPVFGRAWVEVLGVFQNFRPFVIIDWPCLDIYILHLLIKVKVSEIIPIISKIVLVIPA